MPADVQEGPKLAAAVAQHDHALHADFRHEELARFGNAVRPPHAVPRAREDALELQLKDLGIVVVATGERANGCGFGPNANSHTGASCQCRIKGTIECRAISAMI